MVSIALALALLVASQSSPTATATASSPTATASSPTSQSATSVRGSATWYAYRIGQAAAGPRLRSALGTHWRGKVVTVWYAFKRGTRTITRYVHVRLTDWCACPRGRVIDLDRRAFAALASPSAGVLSVRVTH